MVLTSLRKYRRFMLAGTLGALLLCPPPAAAQSRPSIIRDTEIENTLHEWSEPILQAAGMDRDSINIILVQSPDLNAFVAGGANVFLYTGLIERTENPGELIGVFAHELGHISGGHLISTSSAIERASYESILGMVLGIGAAIATGSGEAATAVIAGTSNYSMQKYLAHSRVNESSADQAAMTYLDKAQMNPSGLASFLEKLSSEELMPRAQQSEYVRTHPLTNTRIEAAESRTQNSPYKDKGWPAKWVEEHARMKAKLTGFINPARVSWVYNDQDHSIPARYARTIADYRNNNVNQAISGIDALIVEEPDNPYFHELKGQMLVDFSRVAEGIPSYRRAVELMPNAPLIRIAYAHALLENGQGNEGDIRMAIDNLERALVDEKRSAYANRLLATAHGRLGREDVAKVYLAEEAVLQRNYKYAKAQAESALRTLPSGSREALKARDVISYIDTQKDFGNEGE